MLEEQYGKICQQEGIIETLGEEFKSKEALLAQLNEQQITAHLKQ